MVDLNVRCGNKSDVLHDRNRYNRFIHTLESDENPRGFRLNARNSMDTVTNASGNRLIDLCISSDLRIVNGRISECGQFTNITTNGKSLIDYALASVNLFPVISTLIVHDMFSFSTHLSISVNLCLHV